MRPNYDWTVPQVCSAGWYQDRACSGSEPYRISNSRHELRVGLCRAFQGPEHMKSSSSGAGPCISADSSSELGACFACVLFHHLCLRICKRALRCWRFQRRRSCLCRLWPPLSSAACMLSWRDVNACQGPERRSDGASIEAVAAPVAPGRGVLGLVLRRLWPCCVAVASHPPAVR